MGRMSSHHGTDSGNHAYTVGHVQDVSSLHYPALAATCQTMRSTLQERTCLHVLPNRKQLLGAIQVSRRTAPMGMAGMGSIKELHQQHA